jgi:hypothetical protein
MCVPRDAEPVGVDRRCWRRVVRDGTACLQAVIPGHVLVTVGGATPLNGGLTDAGDIRQAGSRLLDALGGIWPWGAPWELSRKRMGAVLYHTMSRPLSVDNARTVASRQSPSHWRALASVRS